MTTDELRELAWNALSVQPRPSIMTECSVERATQSVHMAVADYIIAIHNAQTNAEALRIHRLISEVVMALGAAEDAALMRADDLSGKVTP